MSLTRPTIRSAADTQIRIYDRSTNIEVAILIGELRTIINVLRSTHWTMADYRWSLSPYGAAPNNAFYQWQYEHYLIEDL